MQVRPCHLSVSSASRHQLLFEHCDLLLEGKNTLTIYLYSKERTLKSLLTRTISSGLFSSTCWASPALVVSTRQLTKTSQPVLQQRQQRQSLVSYQNQTIPNQTKPNQTKQSSSPKSINLSHYNDNNDNHW